jgi:hypothetical protein
MKEKFISKMIRQKEYINQVESIIKKNSLFFI